VKNKIATTIFNI